jgi:hypothetical protein
MQRSDTLTYLPFMVVYLAAAVVFMLVKIFAPGFTLSFAIKVILALSLALATLFVNPMKTFHRMMILAGRCFAAPAMSFSISTA